MASSNNSFADLPVGAKILMLVMLLGMISAGYYFALHMSLAEDIDSEAKKHVQLVQRMQQAKDRYNELLRLQQELSNREVIDQRNKRVLPEDSEIAAFLQDLNRLAELSGLKIRLVEPRPEEPRELYVRLPVTLQLSGRHHQVAKFFHNISRLERAINMENIRLSDPTADSEEVLLNVDVLATTFRRPDAPQQPAAGAAGGAPNAG